MHGTCLPERPSALRTRHISLVLLAGLTVTSACVVPVAPQFDDPEPNFPPFVVSSDPGVGEIITYTADAPNRAIMVIVGDNNLGDSLFVRWLIDYPSTDPDNMRKALEARFLPSTAVIRSPPLKFLPNCNIIPRSAANPHRLVLSISDRPFLDKENGDMVSNDSPFDSVPDGANRTRVVWLLHMDCPGPAQ
jgi:hypothetical protein